MFGVLLILVSCCIQIGSGRVEQHVAAFGPTSGVNNTDPFKSWLANLVIRIPDETFPVNAKPSEGSVSLLNLTCENITLGNVGSNFSNPLRLALNIGGVGVSCNGSIYVNVSILSLPYTAMIGLGVNVSGSTIGYGMQIKTDADKLPVSAICTNDTFDVVLDPNTGIQVFWDAKHKTIQDAIDKILDSTLQKQVPKLLGSFVSQELKNLTEVNLTQFLTNTSGKIRPFAKRAPKPKPPPAPANVVDLFHSWAVTLFDDVLNIAVGVDGPLNINKIMNLLTNDTGMVVFDKLDGVNTTFNISDLANLTVGVKEASIGGLDTWGDLELLEAYGKDSMWTETNMSSLTANLTLFINVSTDPGSAASSVPLYEEFRFALDLSSMSLGALTVVDLNSSFLDPLGNDLFSRPLCVLAALEVFNTSFMQFALGSEALDIAAVGHAFEQDIDGMINNIFRLLTTSFNTAIPALLNAQLSPLLEETIDAVVETVADMAVCEAPPTKAPSNIDVHNQHTITMAYYIAAAVGGVMLVITLLVHRQRAAEIKEGKELDNVARRSVSRYVGTNPDGEGVALVFDSTLSPLVRVFVPVLLVATICGFASSNANYGASVYARIIIDGDMLKTPSLFDFSLINTVSDMWNAHIYPLSALVMLFSGVWPYVKLILMLACWVLPPRVIPVSRRGTMMEVTDAMGKWSLLDTMLMTIFVVAFFFDLDYKIKGADGEMVPVKVMINVEPDWGLLVYIGVTCLSLLLNHVVVYCHRKATESSFDMLHHGRVCLSDFLYTYKGQGYRFRSVGKKLIWFLLFASLVGFLAGVYFDSFLFDFRGLAGYMLDPTFESGNKRSFSVWSLYKAVPSCLPYASEGVVLFMQITFLLFTMVFPALQLVVLQVLWLVPMTERVQWGTLVVAEIFNAWQGIDVFVLAILASILEISKFAQFMIGDMCDGINVILREKFDKELHGDDQCFDNKAQLVEGCWTLVAAGLIQFLVGSLVLALCHTAMMQRRRRDSRVASRANSIVNGADDDDDESGEGKRSAAVGFVVKFLPRLLDTEYTLMASNGIA